MVKETDHRLEKIFLELEKTPLSFLRNIHIENPFLRSTTLGMLRNNRGLTWHQTIVAFGKRILLDELGGNLNGNHVALGEKVGGALFHDIGKFGVAGDPKNGTAGSIEESIRIIDYTPQGFIKGMPQVDKRKQYIIDKNHLHPLLSYLFIQEINQRLPRDSKMPDKFVENASLDGLNHHRSDGRYRTSYPGKISLEGKDPLQVASEFMTEMMDSQIAMLTDRPYRYPLDRKIISQELNRFLENDKILEFILPIFEIRSVLGLRELLHEKCNATLDQIEPYVNEIPQAKILRKAIGGNVNPIDLQEISNRVWKKYQEEISLMLDNVKGCDLQNLAEIKVSVI